MCNVQQLLSARLRLTTCMMGATIPDKGTALVDEIEDGRVITAVNG